VQRGGPGLGGIQPSQADYFQATRPGHGDFHIIALAPNSVQEMVDLTIRAFDLADEYRMTVMMLADGILGQMMEPVELRASEGRSLPEKTWATTGTGGKRKHNVINSLYIKPEVLEQTVFERFERYARLAEKETLFEEYMTDDADIVLVAYGAASRISKNAIAEARAKGIKAGMVRPITLWPFPSAPIAALADKARCFLSVEMSMGQMIDDVRLAVNGKRPVYLCNRTGGMVPTPGEILAKIEEISAEVK